MQTLAALSGGHICPARTTRHAQQQLRGHAHPKAGRLAPHSRRDAARSVNTRALQASAAHIVQYEDVWNEFAQRVSGEWEGATASFAANGEAQQLPEYYVPQAYRDWGVELYDWQSQCSSRADGAEFQSVLRRMMPTVGCEADACAFTEEQRQGQGSAACQVAILPNGSYSEGPVQLEEGAEKAVFEHCLSLPGGKQRIKVVHNLMRNWKTKEWGLESLQLHKEAYDGPWTGRRELGGCGGGQPAISSQQRTTAEQLAGRWSTTGGLSYTLDSSRGQLSASSKLPDRLAREADAQPVLLPLGTWSRVIVAEGAVYAEAGVLLEGGRERLVACREYTPDGKLQRALLGTERRS